jgi:Flp pilus assembly protein TadD
MRVEADRAEDLAIRAGEVPAAEPEVAGHGLMRLGQVGIELHGPVGSLFRRTEAGSRIQNAGDKRIPDPSSEMWNRMGVSYQMLLDLKDALSCYKESLLLRPFNARTLNNPGSAYDSLRNHPKAERQYRRALKVDPTLAQAAMNLGTNLTIQHRYREGLTMYQRAAALDPEVLNSIDATLAVASLRRLRSSTLHAPKMRLEG